MVGILDIGSNTIRLVIYENYKKIYDKAIASEILNDTINNNLTKTGTQKLCDIISFFKNEAKGVQVYAFATYAFRVLENREDVKKEILKKTGVEIEILSGEDEAKCDFYSLLNEIGSDKSGIGMDLGGGSGQVFSFDKEKLLLFNSYPIGAKKIKQTFVKDVFPNEKETEEIRNYIKKFTKDSGKSEILYIMGGTAKTTLKLHNAQKGTQNITEMETEDLVNVAEFIKAAPREVMEKALKERYYNIVCGIIVIEEIAKQIKAKKIKVLSGGVREGYLKNVIEREKVYGN